MSLKSGQLELGFSIAWLSFVLNLFLTFLEKCLYLVLLSLLNLGCLFMHFVNMF